VNGMSGACGTNTAPISIGPWDERGIAAVEATGRDLRSALEAGLQAVMALALGNEPAPPDDETVLSVPIKGEGDDLAVLFADLIDDLLAQVEIHGSALTDITVDGVLRRDRGGYRAWGYAAATPQALAGWPLAIHLQGAPTATEDAAIGITLRATFCRHATG
jgi:hypothetical protein